MRPRVAPWAQNRWLVNASGGFLSSGRDATNRTWAPVVRRLVRFWPLPAGRSVPLYRNSGCRYRTPMSQVRLAALSTLLFSAGCYTDAAPQSTMPEPQYVAGTPGGGMAPGYATSPYAAPNGAAMAPGAAADPSA